MHILGGGGCVRLPRLIGLWASVPLILSGKVMVAKKAYGIKIVDALFAPDTSIYAQDEQYMVTQLERYYLILVNTYSRLCSSAFLLYCSCALYKFLDGTICFVMYFFGFGLYIDGFQKASLQNPKVILGASIHGDFQETRGLNNRYIYAFLCMTLCYICIYLIV